MRKLPKMVKVEWEDSCSDYNYWHSTMPRITQDVVTIGYLARKNLHEVVVTSTRWNDGDMKTCHAIPRRMVKRIVELKEAE